MDTIKFTSPKEEEYTKEVQCFGNSIKLRKYIATSEIFNIVSQCIEAYDSGVEQKDKTRQFDDVPNFYKNVLGMEILFNMLVISTCTNLSEYDYDMLIACGFIEDLDILIVNYTEVKEKIYFIISKRDSLEYVVENALNQLIEKIPNSKEITRLYNKVKKDLTSEKVGEIITRIKDITDIQPKK